MKYATLGFVAVLISALALAAGPAGERPYAVHEWGTFTSVSGADGAPIAWRPLAGPPDLPKFVYTSYGKGAKDKEIKPHYDKLHWIAPIRMETPVLYFYSAGDLDVDVKVKFPEGQVTEWYPRGLSIENGIAYLNAWTAGLQVVDFTNPAQPALIGKWSPTPTKTSHSSWTTTIDGRHIALHGEEEYGAHLDLVDVDPSKPATFMKPFATYKTRDHVSIHNVMAFGAKAYFTYYQDGVRVLDLSDPTAPKLAGYYNTWDPQAAYTTSAFFEGAVGLDVDLARKLIFVADSPRGLLILRDDTP